MTATHNNTTTGARYSLEDPQDTNQETLVYSCSHCKDKIYVPPFHFSNPPHRSFVNENYVSSLKSWVKEVPQNSRIRLLLTRCINHPSAFEPRVVNPSAFQGYEKVDERPYEERQYEIPVPGNGCEYEARPYEIPVSGNKDERLYEIPVSNSNNDDYLVVSNDSDHPDQGHSIQMNNLYDCASSSDSSNTEAPQYDNPTATLARGERRRTQFRKDSPPSLYDYASSSDSNTTEAPQYDNPTATLARGERRHTQFRKDSLPENNPSLYDYASSSSDPDLVDPDLTEAYYDNLAKTPTKKEPTLREDSFRVDRSRYGYTPAERWDPELYETGEGQKDWTPALVLDHEAGSSDVHGNNDFEEYEEINDNKVNTLLRDLRDNKNGIVVFSCGHTSHASCVKANWTCPQLTCKSGGSILLFNIPPEQNGEVKSSSRLSRVAGWFFGNWKRTTLTLTSLVAMPGIVAWNLWPKDNESSDCSYSPEVVEATHNLTLVAASVANHTAVQVLGSTGGCVKTMAEVVAFGLNALAPVGLGLQAWRQAQVDQLNNLRDEPLTPVNVNTVRDILEEAPPTTTPATTSDSTTPTPPPENTSSSSTPADTTPPTSESTTPTTPGNTTPSTPSTSQENTSSSSTPGNTTPPTSESTTPTTSQENTSSSTTPADTTPTTPADTTPTTPGNTTPTTPSTSQENTSSSTTPADTTPTTPGNTTPPTSESTTPTTSQENTSSSTTPADTTPTTSESTTPTEENTSSSTTTMPPPPETTTSTTTTKPCPIGGTCV